MIKIYIFMCFIILALIILTIEIQIISPNKESIKESVNNLNSNENNNLFDTNLNNRNNLNNLNNLNNYNNNCLNYNTNNNGLRATYNRFYLK